MEFLYGIMGLALSGFFIWRLVHVAQARPDFFSLDNLNKSFWTMGVLALLLIALISTVVILL